ASENVDALAGADDDVAADLDILDRRERRTAVLVPNGNSKCRAFPVVREIVVCESNASCVLQFKKRLDRELVLFPSFGFEEDVSRNFDLRWDELSVCGIGAAEHNIFGTAFNVVVQDLDITGARPSANALRFFALTREAFDITVLDDRSCAV